MLKESYSGNYNQGYCTEHGIHLIVLSFLTIFKRKLAMELNIHMHKSINNANQIKINIKYKNKNKIKPTKFSISLCEFPCFQG